MDVTRLVDQIDAALRTEGTPGRAEHEKAYLKSELEHYGTSVPAIRSVAKAVASQHPELSHDDLVVLVKALWVAPVHERRMIGRLTERHPELGAVLDRWARDQDFWIRRAALLALLGPLRRGQGEFERFSRYADAMLEDKEFFVRKAIVGCCARPPRSDPTWSTRGCYRERREPRE